MKYFIKVSFENGEIITIEIDSHSFDSRPPWEAYKFNDTIYDINFSKVNYIQKYKIDIE